MLRAPAASPSADHVPVARPADARSWWRSTLVPLVAWAALVVVGRVAVVAALPAEFVARHDAVPLHADFDPRVRIWVLLPLAVAVVVARWGTRVATTSPWRRLLLLAWVTGTVWALGLAAIRGWQRVTITFSRDGEYLAVLPQISSVGDFLGGFVENIAAYPTHVEGHPPGFPLVAWGFDRVGLGGVLPISLACIAVGAVAAPAALVTVRAVAGEVLARRAAPFLVVAPAAIWIAVSADAWFAGVGAVAVALVVLGVRARGARSDRYALLGGLCFGVTAFLSYGLVLLACIPTAIAIHDRRLRPILLAVVGAAPVFLAFGAAGFWWVEGFFATADRYFEGAASRRPYEAYVLANLSTFVLVLGPAIAVALARLRARGVWLVAGAALAAVVVADVSGMSKAEVERIWLPFVPFVLVVGAALVPAAGDRVARPWWRSPASGWLALNAGYTICFESLIRTAW